MTTLELYRKHKKGEIGRDRFLYEVRRDNNLPWVTNTTSYDDAVKILKNKGIISEAYSNVATDPIVDRVNPYALKRAVHKLLDKEKDLTDDSYVEALNKAAKKLKDAAAVKAEMFSNAESVAKADAKLQTQEVKKANHKDKHNEMKKAKGQAMPKATAASTKENKKTKKPKDVEIMKEKGVEGSEKIIKEISNFIKKKLTENSSYHDFHEGMQVETQYGPAVIKEINGGTLTVETDDGKLYDVQMNHAKNFTDKKKEESEISYKSEVEETDDSKSNNLEEQNIQEASSVDSIIRALEEAQEQLRDGVLSLKSARKQMLSSGDPELSRIGERIYRYMLGHIEPVIDNDHYWMSKNESIQDIIDNLRGDEGEDEDLDEFTTAKTKDAVHNADIVKQIDTTVSNPDAKKQLKQNFNLGKAIDL